MSVHAEIQLNELRQAIQSHALEVLGAIELLKEGDEEGAMATLDRGLRQLTDVVSRHAEENGCRRNGRSGEM